jgi:hypothetical protein
LLTASLPLVPLPSCWWLLWPLWLLVPLMLLLLPLFGASCQPDAAGIDETGTG